MRVWRFIKEILKKSYFGEHTDSTLEKIALVLVFGLFFLHFSTLASVGFQITDSRAIVASNDDDTQAAIELAGKSYLINDNGARAYGPIYYRLESLLRVFPSHTYTQSDLSPTEHRENNIYFHLILINLLSLYLSSFLLIRLLTQDIFYSILGAVGLSAVFLTNDLRSILVFMGKPDLLFTLFMTWAFLQTFFWLKDFSQTRLLLKASSAWALAFSTKLSGLFFIPASLVLLPWKNWKEFRSGFIYFSFSFVAFYFLIGFPQNFDIFEYGRYLIQQNSHTSLVSKDFLVQQWIPLIQKDLLPPLAFVLAFFLFLPFSFFRESALQPLNEVSRKLSLRFLFFSILAYLTLVSKQTTSPFQWYTFPFTNAFLFAALLGLMHWALPLKEKISFSLQKIPGMNKTYVLRGLSLILFAQTVPLFPLTYWNQAVSKTSCRKEARHFKSLIDEQARRGKKIMADANVPYDHQFHDKEIWMTYEMTTSHFAQKKPDFIALKRSYYLIYLPRAEGGLEFGIGHTQDLEDTRNFYRLFFNKTLALAPDQTSWTKIYDDTCGNELWQKK